MCSRCVILTIMHHECDSRQVCMCFTMTLKMLVHFGTQIWRYCVGIWSSFRGKSAKVISSSNIRHSLKSDTSSSVQYNTTQRLYNSVRTTAFYSGHLNGRKEIQAPPQVTQNTPQLKERAKTSVTLTKLHKFFNDINRICLSVRPFICLIVTDEESKNRLLWTLFTVSCTKRIFQIWLNSA
jgi:hypothetical protein